MRKTIEEIYEKKKNTTYFNRVGWDEKKFIGISTGKNVTMDFVLDVLYDAGIAKTFDVSEIVSNIFEKSEHTRICHFADEIGISRETVQKVLSKKNGIGAVAFERICSAYGCDPLEVIKKGGVI